MKRGERIDDHKLFFTRKTVKATLFGILVMTAHKRFFGLKTQKLEKREIKKEGGKRKLSKTLFAIMTGVCVHSFPQNSRDFKNFSCVYLTCLLFYYLKSIKRFVKLQFELEIDSRFCNNIVIKLSCFTFHQRYPDKIYIFWRQGKKRMVCLNE